MSAPLVILAAGGTGGHMFPAEALAAALQERDVRLALLTDARGDEFGGALGSIARYQIRSAGVAGQGLAARLVSMRELALGVIQARALLHRLSPRLAVGFGGYASVPAMLAASFAPSRILIQTLIHEQNAVLGRANRLLAPRVDRIATSFGEVRQITPRAAAKVVRTGMPVRPAFIAARAVPYPHHEQPTEFKVLVLGGSQGARVFSDVLPAAVGMMSRTARHALRICQQCRPEDVERVRAAYAAIGVQADLAAFFADVPDRLAAAHLVIARSGASTVAELTTVGRPSILVPYPFATDDHQSVNAAELARRGGAWTIPQGDLQPERLAAQLELLWRSPETLAAAAAQARSAGQPDATAKLAELVFAMLNATDAGGASDKVRKAA